MASKEKTQSTNKVGEKQKSQTADVQTQPESSLAGLVQRARSDPRLLTPKDVLQLQRVGGNQAVAQMLAGMNPPQPVIQTKLTVGAAGDKYEEEADRVAAQVMHAPAPAASIAQRQSEKDQLQAKSLVDSITPLIQRDPNKKDKPKTKPVANGTAFTPNADFEDRLATTRGNGKPLPKNTRDFMEQRFSTDFSKVRVHTDEKSAKLNQEIGAEAFTHGQDIYFGTGKQNVESNEGKRLLAHELTHVVQQTGAASVKRKSPKAGQTVQRKFVSASTSAKAHLRNENAWGTKKGPAIPKNAAILLDDDNAKIKVEKNTFSKDTQWRPAINVPANHLGNVSDLRKGYIRSSKAAKTGDLETDLQARIQGYLQNAEATHNFLAGHLDKPAHIQFLMNKALRYAEWSDANLDTFAEAFSSLDAKFKRIEDGADYVAKVLAHWKKWIHPEKPARVTIDEINLVESDLHERGLGVIEVKFTKPKGKKNPQFGKQTKVHVFIKPENKTLEQNLLGDNPDSAASKINEIADLKGDAKLQTIKMESTDDYGTLVEAAKGISAEKLWPVETDGNRKPKGDKPISQSFHETLIFSYLAGIDDLHKKNVFWDKSTTGGVPSLVDADNVLSRNQMEDVDSGAIAQTGFGSNFNTAEANKNKQAIRTKDNSQINSKILDVMMNNPAKRREIINVLKAAIQGHRGRVVPVRTNYWGKQLKSYPTNPDKNGFLDFLSAKKFVVRKGVPFSDAVGAGLFGVAGESATAEFWDGAAEKTKTKEDFEAGVIPFYEYDFNTGFVTHNGVKIYNGQTLDEAMTKMLANFGG